MNARDYLPFIGRAARAGHHAPAQPSSERIVTLGWICMVATVIAAMLMVAYVAI